MDVEDLSYLAHPIGILFDQGYIIAIAGEATRKSLTHETTAHDEDLIALHPDVLPLLAHPWPGRI
jgi:hypothetical protein